MTAWKYIDDIKDVKAYGNLKKDVVDRFIASKNSTDKDKKDLMDAIEQLDYVILKDELLKKMDNEKLKSASKNLKKSGTVAFNKANTDSPRSKSPSMKNKKNVDPDSYIADP